MNGRQVALHGFAPILPNLSTMMDEVARSALHELPLDVSSDQSPGSCTVRDLNLSPDYLKQIKGFDSVRELAQNWYDECLSHAGHQKLETFVHQTGDWRLAVVAYGKTPPQSTGYLLQGFDPNTKKQFVQLTNFRTVLNPSILALGRSEKRSSKAAGCFGEGMKVEINRLVALGDEVGIITGRSFWQFAHVEHTGPGSAQSFFPGAAKNESTLKCQITASEDYCGHTSVVVCRDPGKPKLLEPECFLYLLPADQCSPRVRGGDLDILLDPKFSGKVYVHGIYICVSSTLQGIGLNFVGDSGNYGMLRFGRDRNSIDTRKLVEFLPEAMKGLPTQEEKRMLAERLYDVLHGKLSTDIDHLSDLYYFFCATMKPLVDELFKVFEDLHSTGKGDALRAFPVSIDDAPAETRKQLEYLGWRAVQLPTALAKLLKAATNCPTLDQLWSQAESRVRGLPDWQPANAAQREYSERFRAAAADWFRDYLSAHQIVYKQFPPGNVDRVVVAVHGNASATDPSPSSFSGSRGSTVKAETMYCVDIRLLDTEPVHEWMRTVHGEKCADMQQAADGTTRCGGGCVLERFQTALRMEIGRKMNEHARRKLNRAVQTAMLRRETRQLPSLELPPVKVAQPQTPSAGSSGSAAQKPADTPSPTAPSSSASAAAFEQPVASSGVDASFYDDLGDELDGIVNHGARPPTSTRSAETASIKRGAASKAVAAANNVLQHCLRASGMAPPPALQRNATRPKFAFQCCQDAQSKMDLVQMQPIRVSSGAAGDMQVLEVKFYVERSFPRLDTSQQQAAVSLASVCAMLSMRVFGFCASDTASTAHIFFEDSERIAFNRGGNLFFNAHFFHQLKHEIGSASSVSYWYVTFCHELAHNMIESHNVEHESAEETLITHHFEELLYVLTGHS